MEELIKQRLKEELTACPLRVRRSQKEWAYLPK